MNRRRWWIFALLGAAALLWYVFRPERLILNRKVAEAFPDSTRAGAGAPRALLRGAFHGNAHRTTGVATVYRLGDGRLVLRLSEFETSNGPDVQVYLVAAPDVNDDATVTQAGYVPLGALKGNVGDQNYDVPPGTDLTSHRAVTIWCRRFAVNFGTAPLSAAEP